MNEIRYGFKNCTNLREVVIPEGDLKSVGSQHFICVPSLKEVNQALCALLIEKLLPVAIA